MTKESQSPGYAGGWFLDARSGMAQQARAIVTRAAIIRGASIAFQKRGYGSTSLSDVSAAAGVTKGALYFHFDSKEALALAIIEAQHEASRTIGRKLADDNKPGLHAMIIMSIELAKQLRDDPVVRAGVRLTIDAASFSTPVSGPYLDWMLACEEFLRRGIAEGDIVQNVDVSATAHFIIAAFTGVQVTSDVLTGREDMEQRLVEMWAMILPALVPAERWNELSERPSRIRREVTGA